MTSIFLRLGPIIKGCGIKIEINTPNFSYSVYSYCIELTQYASGMYLIIQLQLRFAKKLEFYKLLQSKVASNIICFPFFHHELGFSLLWTVERDMLSEMHFILMFFDKLCS